MSDSLFALNALAAITSWRNDLSPGSFRGVPFYADGHESTGGRRVVVHEFPLRDAPYTEDLGRLPQRFRLRAWVVGDDYMDQRDALLAACQNSADPGLLVHPWLGEIMCRAAVVAYRESKDRGGAAYLDIEFIEAAEAAAPFAAADTISSVLKSVRATLRTLMAAYQQISLITQDPAYVLSQCGGLLGLLGAALAALPAASIAGQQQAIAAVPAAPGDDLATAAAVTTAFGGIADTVVAQAAPATGAADPVTGQTWPDAAPSDPSGGLAALASWGGTLAPVTGTTAAAVAQAGQQTAVVILAQGAAAAALAGVYAQIDWPYAQAAAAARGQVLDLLDAQAQLAADAGLDDLWRAWQAVTAASLADMIARAQSLPSLAAYAVPEPLPALVLAHRLTGDPAQAQLLERLNDVPHALFMPQAGQWLTN